MVRQTTSRGSEPQTPGRLGAPTDPVVGTRSSRAKGKPFSGKCVQGSSGGDLQVLSGPRGGTLRPGLGPRECRPGGGRCGRRRRPWFTTTFHPTWTLVTVGSGRGRPRLGTRNPCPSPPVVLGVPMGLCGRGVSDDGGDPRGRRVTDSSGLTPQGPRGSPETNPSESDGRKKDVTGVAGVSGR